MNKIVTETEYVTPERAKYYLSLRTEKERALGKRRVESMARDMEKGRWYQTGQPISFDSDGHLVDGQHRLSALLESGLKGMEFQVQRGLSDDAISVLDTGARRSTKDFFQMEGHSYASSLASASRHVFVYMETGTFVGGRLAVTVSDQREVLRAFPELEQYVKAYAFQKLPIQLPSAALAALHVLFRTVGPKSKADEFFEGLVSGEGLAKGDPRLTARNYITRRSWGFAGQSAAWCSDKFPIRAMAVIIMAWNRWRAGETYNTVQPIRIWPVISK